MNEIDKILAAFNKQKGTDDFNIMVDQVKVFAVYSKAFVTEFTKQGFSADQAIDILKTIILVQK